MEDVDDCVCRVKECRIFCVAKVITVALVAVFVLFFPLGDPNELCNNENRSQNEKLAQYVLCEMHRMSIKLFYKTKEVAERLFCKTMDLLYQVKLKFYTLLEKLDRNDLYQAVCCSLMKTHALNVDKDNVKDDVDKVIEDEITRKLGEDLLQSIERKFQVDLERSVDMVLVKIKLLLHNGTQHIQEKLLEIQTTLDTMKSHAENEVDKCLEERHNVTSALAEKALHQMVVCGYALIGQDPEQAVRKVTFLKNMIKQEIKPLHEQKKEIYSLLKVCGHDHDSLTKVVKCVISKSPAIKSVMMEITGKLINGVIDLSKLMAHGAMHEACLIEVIKTIEDEAMDLVKNIRKCTFENNTEFDNYIIENNATVLDITNAARERNGKNNTSVREMQEAIKKMLNESNDNGVDKRFKKKLFNLQNDLNAVDADANIIDVANDLKTVD